MKSYDELKAEIAQLQTQLAQAKQREQPSGLQPLKSYSSNTYSQFGEDGIISEILSRLRTAFDLDNWCAEFGAWDGVHLANTCKLVRDESYSAVYIEGDAARVEDLKVNHPQASVYKIHRFVSFEGDNTLDKIFAETPIPQNFDFLSIDVDGVDYHIFESLRDYRPKVVCIEFNPAMPNGVDFVQPRDFGVKQGSSARAMVRLAKEKGYQLATATEANLFFVDSPYFGSVCPEEPRLEEINQQGNDPQYIFPGFDGTILSNKDELLLAWHGVPVPIAKLQFLPRPLRKFYGDYGNIRWFYFSLYTLLRIPKQILKYRGKVREKILKDLRQRLG